MEALFITQFGCGGGSARGLKSPGAKSGNFVPDHQPPSALAPEGLGSRGIAVMRYDNVGSLVQRGAKMPGYVLDAFGGHLAQDGLDMHFQRVLADAERFRELGPAHVGDCEANDILLPARQSVLPRRDSNKAGFASW